jgi:hypothetical protein
MLVIGPKAKVIVLAYLLLVSFMTLLFMYSL